MSRLTWALCAVTIILVVLSIVRAARGQPWPRPARIVAVVAVILAIADVAVNEVQFLLVPVYLAVALLAVRLWVWGRGHGLWRYRWLGVASGLVFLLLVLADTALVRMMASLGDANELFVTRRESPDLRGKGWEAGFREANAFLAEDYAFGKWRRVNFDSLVNVYAPRVAAAEQRKDWRAYYQAVRECLWSIPDSHIEIGSDSTDVRQQHIEGGTVSRWPDSTMGASWHLCCWMRHPQRWREWVGGPRSCAGTARRWTAPSTVRRCCGTEAHHQRAKDWRWRDCGGWRATRSAHG